MANNKDFILKNAVEVGGPTNVTLGTITGNAVNLSTGNYFKDTLAANTTYTISNAGDVQSFQLEVTGGKTSSISLSDATNTNRSFTPNVTGGPCSWNNDGTKFYLLNWSTGPIRQYVCSTAYDISTATLDFTWTPTSYGGAAYRGMFIGRSGTRLYLLDDNSTLGSGFHIREFNITGAAYDLTNASTSQSNKSTNYEYSAMSGMTANEDFTKIYLMGNNKTIYYYTLGAVSQVGNIQYQSATSYSSLTNTTRECQLSSDGSKIAVTGQNEQLDFITFTTAYDPTAGSVETFDMTTIGVPDSNYYGLAAKPDLSEITVAANTNLNQIYTISLIPTATLTWPTSIEFAGGLAPAAPANGETDIFTFSTDDGGTSYIGTKTADNLS